MNGISFKKFKVGDLEKMRAKYNPRKVLKAGDVEYEKLKKSIQEFGLVRLLVVNLRTNTLISGHQTLTVLKDLGVEEVDVITVDLPLEKEKLANLALNKIQSTWDFEKLAEMLDDLSKMPDLDEGLSGFETKEIGSIFDQFLNVDGDGAFDAQIIVDSLKESITQPGDIITLGQHRVMCADATLPENLKALCQDERADLYWSDWPYRVDYDSTRRPRSSGKKLWEKITGDDMSQEAFNSWMLTILRNTAPYIKEGAALYVWNGNNEFWTMQQLLRETGFHPASVIVWAKPSISPGYADYQWQTEFCLYGWKLGASHSWYGKNESNLWEVGRDAVSERIHPTQKSLELVERALRNSSQRGQIVLDSCLGSGSCLIAAQKLGRKCLGFEIDGRYCDAIVHRYIAAFGKDAVSQEIRDKYLGGQSNGK